MPIIVRTLPQKGDKPGSGPMLQDTIAGKVYTHRRPHLTEINGFIEGFLNKQVVSLSGEAGSSTRYRPAQLQMLAGTEDCEHLNEDVTDRDLADAWADHIKQLVKEDKYAEEKLTADDWKKWVGEWIKANSGRRKTSRSEETKNEGNQTGQGQGGQRQGGSTQRA